MLWPFALLCDLLIASLSILVIGILVSGGGEFHTASKTIRLHSLENPIAILSVLVALRLLIANRYPFWGNRKFTADKLAVSSWRFLDWLNTSIRGTSLPAAWRFVRLVAAIALLVKLANAWFYFGFFSGDDVEVQEMSLASLLHWDWSAWGLRSAFYPFTFIYPAHWLAHSLGINSPFGLVFAGRAAAALWSSLGLLAIFAQTVRVFDRRTAIAFAALLGFSGLLLAFGGSELPRPIGAVFVCLGFFVLRRESMVSASSAGLLIGVAAAMRFSEVVFVLPALIQLAIDKQPRRFVAFGLSFALAAGGIQVVADLLYWGAPFHSAIEAYNYTLVAKLSSRGYEPLWYYLTHIPDWSNLILVGLAVWGTRRVTWRESIWAWVPLVMLSLLPHKEPRYLIPVLPFVTMLAAFGWLDVFDRVLQRPPNPQRRLPIFVCVALVSSLLLQLGAARFRRSESDVRLASRIVSNLTQTEAIAVEQAWRLGNQIYLGGNRRVVNLDADDFGAAASQNLDGVSTVALLRTTCRDASCHKTLASLGFHEDALGTTNYVVFTRNRQDTQSPR